MAHIAERGAGHYLPIVLGHSVTCCPNPREVIAYLPEVRPTWFFAVPRIWEKLKAGLEAMIEAEPDEQREPVEWALAAAIEKVRLEQAGEEVPEELAAGTQKADEAVLSKLREQLGLDEVEAVNVGAAPTPLAVLEFFHAIGVPVGELWGLSESCGVGDLQPPGQDQARHRRPPVPGMEMKLAEDGEVLIRGAVDHEGLSQHARQDREAIDADGWLHTGDIGELDDDGYLKIVDRKKELIITAGGKNMSPANIEAKLKPIPLIGQAVVIGDRRTYDSALLVLDPDVARRRGRRSRASTATLADAGRERGAAGGGPAGRRRGQRAGVARRADQEVHGPARADWVPGGDELTPTMKLKRKPIAEKYASEIEAMYEG